MEKKDPLSKSRMKARFIVEIRYPPLVQTFDRRGKILDKIFPEFQNKAEHWKVENVQVIITDNLEKGKRQIAINHLRSSIVYEDFDSKAEFLDDCQKFFRLLYGVFPEIVALKRIGFRSVSIFKHKNAKSYSEIYSAVKEKFLCPSIPSTLGFTDCSVILSHKNCNVRIGPAKKGEDWVKGSFVNPDSNVPDYGIGIDIDSFSLDLSCPNAEDLLKAIFAVGNLTFQLESELLSDLV